MEILLPLLTVLGVLGIDPAPEPSRQARLYTVLDRVVVLHEASSTRDAGVPTEAPPDADRDMALDLVHMELASGYLAGACVCDDQAVAHMRMMIAYVAWLRFIGESDSAIEARLVAGAGDDAPRVREFMGFAGLDGISHFICADFMAEALELGMPAAELRAYIDELAPPPQAPQPGGTMRLAARS